jgi:MFS family permease
VTGGLALAGSGVMLTRLAPETPAPLLLGAYAAFGFGFALVSPPIANTAVSGMPPAQAGVAAAVATTSRQVGLTLGVAVLGAVVGGGTGGAIGRDFAHATRPGWWIVAALGLAVAVLGYVTTTSWAHHTALRTAKRLEDAEPFGGQLSPALDNGDARFSNPRSAATQASPPSRRNSSSAATNPAHSESRRC